MEEILNGRLELVETNRHGLGLNTISVSEGILDFRVEAKHFVESWSRSWAEMKYIDRTKRYSNEERENKNKNSWGPNDENRRVFEGLIVSRLDWWLDSKLNGLPPPRWRLAQKTTNKVSLFPRWGRSTVFNEFRARWNKGLDRHMIDCVGNHQTFRVTVFVGANDDRAIAGDIYPWENN